MAMSSQVELRGLELATDIGTYGPNDVVPDTHILDLTLGISPDHVMIACDDMAAVFDYDPLIADIDRVARDGHYETQERLMTRIVEICATYSAIQSVEIMLTKTPVLLASGHLGVRLSVDAESLSQLRQANAA